MIEAIRVFSTQDEVKKPGYTPEFRKKNTELPEIAFLKRVFIKNETLFIPGKAFDRLSESMNENTGTVLLFDTDTLMGYEIGLLIFDKAELVMESHSFIIKKKEDLSGEQAGHKTELYMRESLGGPLFPFPKGEEHKIANLKPGSLVHYKINFKTDSYDFRDRQRAYKEVQYLFHHLGTFQGIEKLKTNTSLDKHPVENMKVVDERKILK